MSPLPDSESDDASTGPPLVVRVVISIAVVVYGLAMLAVATGTGTGRFSPPLISTKVLDVVTPVFRPLHLDNSHRYYVPNPGSQPVLWLHLVYESGDARWLQWPTRDLSSSQLAHVRMLLIPNAISDRLVVSTVPEQSMLTTGSRIKIASVARRLARDFVKSRENGQPDEIASIQFYSVDQNLMTPVQIRAGWDFTDLRLIRTTYLGSYSRSGKKLGVSNCTPVAVHELVARIIEREIAPLVNDDDQAALSDALDHVSLPRSIRVLVEGHPDLLSLESDELRSAVREAVVGLDRPEVQLVPGLDYDKAWVPDDVE